MIALTGQFIALCWVVLLVVWVVAASRAKRDLERQNWALVATAVVGLVAAFLLVRRSDALPPLLATELWPRSLLSGIAADIVTLAGLAVALWARTALGTNWSVAVTFKENHELVESGPYRYVRHPIYSGFLLMVLGAAIYFGHSGGFIGFAALFAALWFKARQEERLLTRHFADEYPRYQARVKALVPFVL
jgi:protein-S-isoprenylcysteine O-methyltransferase Ste14